MATISNYTLYGGDINKLVANSVPSGAGEKPGRQKKPRRGHNNIRSSPITRVVRWDDPILDIPKPFQPTKPWHNKKPFLVHLLTDGWCKNAKECASCEVHFPANSSPEAKIIIIHAEKVVQNGKDKRMFYCCKKKCLIDRHPYFWKGLIKVTEAMKLKLTEVHLEILYENLNYIQ